MPAMPKLADDRDEILQLLYRYNHLIDAGDGEGWAGLFTDDGVLDAAGHVVTGHAGLAEFGASVGGMRHVVANPVIDVSGDTGTVQAYVFAFHGTRVAIVGAYQDEVVRTPAGWRFAKRVLTIPA